MATNLVVFGYEFPHAKTFEGLHRLKANGLQPDLVIAAPREKLALRQSPFRDASQNFLRPSTADVCAQLEIPVRVLPHRSAETENLLAEAEPKLGLILGARIIPKRIIDLFSVGIVNLHPGLLPENAGLNNLEWAVAKRLPQGMTAHLINQTIDGGRIIQREIITSLPKGCRVRDVQAAIAELELATMVSLLRAPDELGLATNQEAISSRYHMPLTLFAELRARLAWRGYVGRYERIVHDFLAAQKGGV